MERQREREQIEREGDRVTAREKEGENGTERKDFAGIKERCVRERMCPISLSPHRPSLIGLPWQQCISRAPTESPYHSASKCVWTSVRVFLFQYKASDTAQRSGWYNQRIILWHFKKWMATVYIVVQTFCHVNVTWRSWKSCIISIV